MDNASEFAEACKNQVSKPRQLSLAMATTGGKGKPPPVIPHVSWSMPVIWLESEKLVTRTVEDGVETVTYTDVVNVEEVVTSLQESGKRPLFIVLDPDSLVQAVRPPPRRGSCTTPCHWVVSCHPCAGPV